MDEINKRLSDAAQKCMASYDSWRKDQSAAEVREALNEALHELRRATAALEIEMIRQERATPGGRNIPTPGHRAMRRREGGEGGGEDDSEQGDNIGNRDDGNHQGGGHGGGGHGGGGGGANMARHMRRRRPGGREG